MNGIGLEFKGFCCFTYTMIKILS